MPVFSAPQEMQAFFLFQEKHADTVKSLLFEKKRKNFFEIPLF